MCEHFLSAENHDRHRLCVSCHGKSCTVDDRSAECAEWSDKCCRDVAAYAVKLSARREKKRERKAKSLCAFFFRLFTKYASAAESTRLYIGEFPYRCRRLPFVR